MRILGISGSLRLESHNTSLLRHIAGQAPAGTELDLWAGLRAIPPYDEDEDIGLGPAPVADLRAAIAGSDGILIATPEYNSSVPGALKNALDWASRPRASTPLQGKPAAVIGATTGSFGAVWAQVELRKILGSTGARVVELDLSLSRAHEAFDAAGGLLAPEMSTRCTEVLAALVAEINADRALVAAA